MLRLADINIRPKLVFLFVITGIIPLAIVGFYGSQMAVDALMEKSFNQLITVQHLRKGELETTFQLRWDAMEMLAGHPHTLWLVKSVNYYHAQHDPQLISDNKAAKKAYSGYLNQFLQSNDYMDLIIIGVPHGHILFSMNGKIHPDGDLSDARYHDSGLRRAFDQVVEKKKSVLVDFSPYRPAGGMEAAFLAEPVFDDDHEFIGVIVALLPSWFLTGLIESTEGMGQTGESYIVALEASSHQFELRSDMKTMGEGQYVTGFRLGRALDYWNDAVAYGEQGHYGTYTDSVDSAVLSAFNQLSIDDVNWYLISKIDEFEVEAPVRKIIARTAMLSLALVLFIGIGAFAISRWITRPIIKGVQFAQAISEGNYDAAIAKDRNDELGKLAKALNHMARNLSDLDWMKKGKEALDDAMRGEDDEMVLARRFIRFIVPHLGAQLGAVYTHQEGELILMASYAFTDRQGNFNTVKLGEGMVGQAALEHEVIIFSDVQEDVPMVNYGIGERPASHYMIVPLHHEEDLVGVFVVGSVSPFTGLHRQFIDENMENVAIVMGAAKSRKIIKSLYEQAQEQKAELVAQNKALAEKTLALESSESELQAQQEELQATNEELEAQANALKASEKVLHTQQEELRVTNEELESHAKAQMEQKKALEARNQELIDAQRVIEKKAKELGIASRYKSEFLANMSHELRTPLNSILILSQLLAANSDENLTHKQVQSAGAIHSSGEDLLKLINEILDLSKVESGKVELVMETVDIQDIVSDLTRIFKGLSEQKGVGFSINVHPDLPQHLYTDSQRVQQILRNLITNAFKFTEQGEVLLDICRPSSGLIAKSGVEGIAPHRFVSFSVADQGIGIPKAQQQVIFEAFKQADGGTSRKYGGTGLGLAISKELAKLLGGWIHLESEAGQGSVFTVTILERADHLATVGAPSFQEAANTPHSGGEISSGQIPVRETASPPSAVNAGRAKPLPPSSSGDPLAISQTSKSPSKVSERPFLEDDRKGLTPDDKSLLIIEDDEGSAKIMRDFGREKGFKCIVAESGETGLHFADYYRPSAIILDIGLPGIDGWTVMKRLKSDSRLSHIPVHFMSAADSTMDAMRMGAIGFLSKPVSLEKVEGTFARIEQLISRPVRHLLVVEDDAIQRESINALIGNGDVETTMVESGDEALTALSKAHYDCMILDLGLKDMSGFELLEAMHQHDSHAQIPVIIYTGRDLTQEEDKVLRRYTERIIIKGVKSPERLLEESALFLHRVEENLPEEKRQMLQMTHQKEAVLNGKTILLVDDDMRNVFALSSVLEEKGLNLIIARDGVEGVEKVQHHPEIDLILMDIMMPNMDGYQAMAEIRKDSQKRELPIIALTAKAMKGDRDKCMEAGASDYLAKPVDMDKLISMLKVWLYS